MTSPFDNSRCSDILESAFSHQDKINPNTGKPELPLDAKILTILTLKMGVIAAFAKAGATAAGINEMNIVLNEAFKLLIPELASPAGAARYTILAETFIRDMKDIRNGKL